LTVSALSDVERRFFEELNTRGVKYMVVGLTAAIAQGANTVTRDIDLWFETVADIRIREAADAVGGIWVSGFGMMPARLGGALGDRFDVVYNMSGLDRFEAEYQRAMMVMIDGVTVRVLPLDRILTSKRAADRPKDRAVIPALEEALAAIEGSET
jgi:predicted nucleotidyltransferase